MCLGGQFWKNNMEKAPHNQISCLKCFEGVCVNRAQCMRWRNDFLLQAQRFADERQEGRSRNHQNAGTVATWRERLGVITSACRFHVVVIMFSVMFFSMCHFLKTPCFIHIRLQISSCFASVLLIHKCRQSGQSYNLYYDYYCWKEQTVCCMRQKDKCRDLMTNLRVCYCYHKSSKRPGRGISDCNNFIKSN